VHIGFSLLAPEVPRRSRYRATCRTSVPCSCLRRWWRWSSRLSSAA